ncbi:FdtA/QdtA family cupin domain-containing protein [Halobacteriovorax sp. RZ-3]|uniref:sugar 3,4-ketoisomerase n=1 Tax=Halobacteriovorax sp. RZ-3 TaxID=3157720 RepID=UPI00371FB02B
MNQMVEFHNIVDSRGKLVSLESGINVPFEIKRVYYIYDVDTSLKRGFHAHKNLKQVAVCVSGSCTLTLDNGKTKEDYLLDNPSKGLLIGSNIWREMGDFSPDCVLMVLASELYDEDDYIRDYDEFLRTVSYD